jgi:copper chaperone CopZ
MNLLKRLWPLYALLLALPSPAQVEKIAMRTTGISCGICAGLSEIYFRRLPGVDQVKISLKKEAILLTYKAGASFDPQAIRQVLEPMKVGVIQFQIGARGAIEETADKRWFVAGKERFLLLDSIHSPPAPLHTPVRVEGILLDHDTPMKLELLTVKVLR